MFKIDNYEKLIKNDAYKLHLTPNSHVLSKNKIWEKI